MSDLGLTLIAGLVGLITGTVVTLLAVSTLQVEPLRMTCEQVQVDGNVRLLCE